MGLSCGLPCVGCGRARAQKKAAESINARLQLVMKSGKVALGYKQVIRTLRSGKGESLPHSSTRRCLSRPSACEPMPCGNCVRRCCACRCCVMHEADAASLLFPRRFVDAAKYVIISKNCPPLRKSEIEYYAMLAKTNVHHYSGKNSDLGTACGKFFRASTLSILDAGDSDIIRAMPSE